MPFPEMGVGSIKQDTPMRLSLSLLIILALAAAAFAHPDHELDSLTTLANAAYDDERYDDCAKLYVEAIEAGRQTPGIYYNCACCFALAGDANAAFFYLEEAIAHDFTNVQHLKDDPDLELLTTDARWPDVVEHMSGAQRDYLKREGLNEELFFMMKEDQAARKGDFDDINWDSVSVKDRERLSRVQAMADNGELKATEDYLNAALIFQHGADSAAYRRARELSLMAVKLDSTNRSARWLAAAAMDRYLQSVGQPQIYGTQFRKGDDGKWTLEPMDTTTVTDIEREQWNVPTLAKARERVREMNKNEPKQPKK